MSFAVLPASRAMQDLGSAVLLGQLEKFDRTLKESEDEVVDFLTNPDLGVQATADPLGNTLMHDIFIYGGICWESFQKFDLRYRAQLSGRVCQVLDQDLPRDLILLVLQYVDGLYSWETMNDKDQTPFVTAVTLSHKRPEGSNENPFTCRNNSVRNARHVHVLLQGGYRPTSKDVLKSSRIIEEHLSKLNEEFAKIKPFLQHHPMMVIFDNTTSTQLDHLSKSLEILKKM